MTSIFRSAWAEVISPLLRRPAALQLAALCWRDGDSGREILMITSSRGRWILPKGWPMDGLTAPEVALREAWEEAGVREGIAAKTSIGGYNGRKCFDSGAQIACRTEVFEVEVVKMAPDYPESDARERRWVSVLEAANLASDPGLKSILKTYAAG